MSDIYRLIIPLLEAREALLVPIRSILNEYSLTEQQWRILRLLEEVSGEGLEAGQIATQCCLLHPSLTRILERLERDGMITRKRSALDLRRSKIRLTVRSRSLIGRIQPRIEAQYRSIEAKFGRGKLEEIYAALRRVQEVGRDEGDGSLSSA
ncbi:MAG: homoprotocatechuate degradation operon regulator HpaR [Paraburkholderia tropica]|uniref:homoprotocatechuate degradation operon regulator HpaR n=1 Tax=Burkholderia gladioli TaxID=28095 RepID=UPI00050E1855|nr:homoprotocatechuate degradation operon regulator HpaR [Burkholderia gladioli]KGE05999.1 MarR family transcriptional regulator [Burkholderia gladioli]